jgi:phenylalanyl-tRNA synthetase beta chain
MKFPLSLLKQFLQTDAPLDVIADNLTSIGLEVENIEDNSAALRPFEVAEITSAEKHPDADKLKICSVKTAHGDLQIVCGAPNARAGIKVALAKVGSVIPTNGMKIKASKIRGIESSGMLCSAAELGLSEDAQGIIELPQEAVLGNCIVQALHLDDPVIELCLTPNRGDCFGVYGIARDLAAKGVGTLIPLKAPEIQTSSAATASQTSKAPLHITINDTQACAQFIGRKICGVKNAASPEWLQRVLTLSGMRSISALVDVTNYFALAYGRPLHVFDAAKVSGNLHIRAAKSGEILQALDENSYTLTEHDCVIADDNGVLALAGIMGGMPSAVSEDTTDIILETALFDAERVALSARHHQILSDARTRFERGVDTGFLPLADQLATQMILTLCNGTPNAPIQAGAAPQPQAAIKLNASFITRLSGLSITQEQAEKHLTALGFTVQNKQATPPSWRHDITCEADLAEEVLRLIGYDAIPTISLPKPAGHSLPAFDKNTARILQAKRVLAMRGLNETISYAFVSDAQAASFQHQTATTPCPKLQNPIAEQLNSMRPNLLPSLLLAAADNMARGQKSIYLFESGSVFSGLNPQDEHPQIAGLRISKNQLEHWQKQPQPDLFTAKADAGAILALYGLKIDACQITRDVPCWYHPGRAGAVKLGPKNTLAYFGELHPNISKQFDIDAPIHAFEIMLDSLPAPKNKKRQAASYSDFPPVSRDFAFVINRDDDASGLLKNIAKSCKDLLRDIHVFDVYEGKNMADGKRSIALNITLQSSTRTLSEADINDASTAIIAAAQKYGAELRS